MVTSLVSTPKLKIGSNIYPTAYVRAQVARESHGFCVGHEIKYHCLIYVVNVEVEATHDKESGQIQYYAGQ